MDNDDDDQLTELQFSEDEEYEQLKEKLANERERLQRPDSADSDDDSQLKLQQAMLRRQELLDRIRQEQVLDDQRPRTYSPRRRYTPSPLPPPSRRSLPDLNRAYHFNWYNKERGGGERYPDVDRPERPRTKYLFVPNTAPHRKAHSVIHEVPPLVYNVPQPDMAQTKHIIEHQFRPADPAPQQQRYTILPPIQAQPQVTTIQTPPPIIQQMPSVQFMDSSGGQGGRDKFFNKGGNSFNKGDFMDMMMLQNAQMHHMVMQQMMLQNLPGGGGGGHNCRLPTAQVPLAPVMAEARPMMSYAPPPVVHHYQSVPPLDIRGPPSGGGRVFNGTMYDDGSNYYTYH